MVLWYCRMLKKCIVQFIHCTVFSGKGNVKGFLQRPDDFSGIGEYKKGSVGGGKNAPVAFPSLVVMGFSDGKLK
jgi:hypothetical protein